MNGARLWSLVVPILFAAWHSVANAGAQFDDTKRVVLPSDASTTILKWYVADGNWITENWPISSGQLGRLELTLATSLIKVKFGSGPPKLARLYRQYMPARWKDLHLIVVNGFDETMFDMEKLLDKNVDLTQWKRELFVSFGGGCLQWRAIYIVEQNRFMLLNNLGRRATVICNAPK
jgi:hypothetical protein